MLPIYLSSVLLFQKITDDDLIALMSDEVLQPNVYWKLGDVQVDEILPLCCLCLSFLFILLD